jgi:hypothetical protein
MTHKDTEEQLKRRVRMILDARGRGSVITHDEIDKIFEDEERRQIEETVQLTEREQILAEKDIREQELLEKKEQVVSLIEEYIIQMEKKTPSEVLAEDANLQKLAKVIFYSFYDKNTESVIVVFNRTENGLKTNVLVSPVAINTKKLHLKTLIEGEKEVEKAQETYDSTNYELLEKLEKAKNHKPYVPEPKKETFEEWLARQPKEVQDRFIPEWERENKSD